MTGEDLIETILRLRKAFDIPVGKLDVISASTFRFEFYDTLIFVERRGTSYGADIIGRIRKSYIEESIEALSRAIEEDLSEKDGGLQQGLFGSS